MTLEGWKEKSVSNLLESIGKSKQAPFERVLFSLGIRHIGETTAKLLASHFKNIDNLRAATKEELLTVEEVGETIANSILEYFSNSENLAVIQRLKEVGLRFDQRMIHLQSQNFSRVLQLSFQEISPVRGKKSRN